MDTPSVGRTRPTPVLRRSVSPAAGGSTLTALPVGRAAYTCLRGCLVAPPGPMEENGFRHDTVWDRPAVVAVGTVGPGVVSAAANAMAVAMPESPFSATMRHRVARRSQKLTADGERFSARPPIARSRLHHRCSSVDEAQDEERGVLPEELGVRLAAEPSGPARVVLPTALECAVGDVELVVSGEVLTEHDRDLVCELLRVGSGRRRTLERRGAPITRCRPGG